MHRVWISLASVFWSGASQVARWGAHWGGLKKTRLDARVISVGNLQAGGTGKTPLVAHIAREAHERGLIVCILSRGYKSQWESQGGLIEPGEGSVKAEQCGDEVALLQELCPYAWIGIGSDRVRQFRNISKKSPSKVDLVILDDGFQHWRIQKDLEIVALTSAKPGQVPFRDFYRSLKYADLLVWTKGNQRPDSCGKPMVRVKYELPSAPTVDSHWLITGIADSQSAALLARQSGYRVTQHISLKDHTRYEKIWIQETLKAASLNHSKIALTGKDWVKWRDLGIQQSEVIVIEPKLVFIEGQEVWSRILWGK